MKKITATAMPLYECTEEDAKLFMDWVWLQRSINMFDPQVLTYPRTVMCKAGTEEETMLYIPLQPVLMWDAIAPKPGLTARQEALCLWKIGQVVEDAMKLCGFGEAYFLCSDDRVADICAEHGFEEIKGVRVLRKKLKPEELPLSNTVIEAGCTQSI